MIRMFIVLTLFMVLTSLAALLANLPGEVSIALPGYVVRMKMTVLAGLLTAALIIISAVGLGGLSLWHWPARLRAKRRETLRREAEQAMAGGLMALARGDTESAVEATRAARRKLPHAALPRLLAAQAALMDDRPDDAAANYHAMLAEDMPMAQKSLGLEGLYHLARDKGDIEAAGTYALQVLEVNGKALWALEGLTGLAVQIGDWAAAESWLTRCARAGLPRAIVKQRRAVLALAEAQDLLAQANHFSDAAAQLDAAARAEKAAGLDAKLVPAVALAARLQMKNGKSKQAQKLLKQAWGKAPHPVLAEAWLECHEDQPVAGRMRAVGQFIGRHKAHEEALILRARIALAAARYRQAISVLKPLLETENIARRVCLLMAEAEAGLNDEAAAQDWRAKARQAPPSPGWYGDGIRLEEWQALCPASGRLGGVSWRAPPQGQMLLAAM